MAAVASVVGTETNVGREISSPQRELYWLGGREGHVVLEDDWTFDRSWFFSKNIFPICSCEWHCHKCSDSLRVYLKLFIAGSHKGKCRPTTAWLKVGINSDRHGRYDVDLCRRSVTSVKQAQAWADGYISEATTKVTLQQFYSTCEPKKRGKLIEKLEPELGWCEWLWTFEEYPDWARLGNFQPMRITDSEGRVSIIKCTSVGYSISTWPSRWDRIRGVGSYLPNRDEYGAL